MHRRWAIAATARIVHEQGHDAVTIAGVAHRAGIRTSTVERLFTRPEHCLGETFDEGLRLAAQRTIPRFASQTDPIERLRVAAASALDFCEHERELASVLTLPHPTTADRQLGMVATLGRILAEELAEGLDDRDDDRVRSCIAAIEAALALVGERVQRLDAQGLLQPLLETLLTPRLGTVAAKIQAARPAPHLHTARGDSSVERYAQTSLDLRLTSDLLAELIALRQRGHESQ